MPSGVGSGHRIHKSMTVFKDIDKASPLINTALCNGEMLTLCRLELYRVSPKGEQEHYYTIELKNAVVIGADVYMHDSRDPRYAHLNPMEKVRFSYQEIIWKHETARTIGSDEWRGAGQV